MSGVARLRLALGMTAINPYLTRSDCFRRVVIDYERPSDSHTAWRWVVQLTRSLRHREERLVQLAERDFPEGLAADAVLDRLLAQEGAISGAVLAYTPDGYDPVSEIIRLR